MADSRTSPTGHNINIHTENYLKTIWNLSRLNQNQEELVQNSQIADLLGVKRPTVSEMLKRLEEMGFLKLIPRRGVRLSSKGERFVASILRRHRLIELFLQQTLKITSVEAHEQAEVLEHAVTPELCAFIEKFLGNPEYDLHGMPIPNALYKKSVSSQPYMTAASLKLGQWAKVSACPDYNEIAHQKILAKGISVGLKLKRVDPVGDSSRYSYKTKQGKLFVLTQQEAELVQMSLNTK